MQRSPLLAVTAFTLTLAAAVSAAHATQEERVDCYAQVHESCFPSGGEPKCSQQEYNDVLNLCDSLATEDDGTTERPRVPGAFAGKMTKSDPVVVARLKAQLKRSFGR